MDPETHFGGVARFARDLKRAVPDLEFLHHGLVDSPFEQAGGINERFLKDGKILPTDTVVADGYYGLGLAGEVDRLIVVCHSTYAGWLRDHDIWPPPGYKGDNAWLMKAAIFQSDAYRDADELVAVSTSAAEELYDFYNLDSAVIFNGIDPDEYPDTYDPKGPIVEVSANDDNKGADAISDLREDGVPIASLGFSGTLQERWGAGFSTLFQPSRHEGGSYATLEAMSSNLKLVGFRSGFFKHDIPKNTCWSTSDFYHGTFRRLIDLALEADNPDARDLAVNKFSLDKFIEAWRDHLGVNDETGS
jgi:glycosyltransferase involved in cell wall biosynthesis